MEKKRFMPDPRIQAGYRMDEQARHFGRIAFEFSFEAGDELVYA